MATFPYTYWRHKTTGEIYAIRVEDGYINGMAGPIPPDEALRDTLPAWPYNPVEGHQLQRRISEYTPLTTKQTRGRRKKLT
jgi:hypothetical protein